MQKVTAMVAGQLNRGRDALKEVSVKREMMAFDLAAARLFSVVLQLLWRRLLECGVQWPVGKGLRIEVMPDKCGADHYRAAFIHPMGWPDDHYIFARFTETRGCWTPFEGSLHFGHIGVHHVCFKMEGAHRERYDANWELEFKDSRGHFSIITAESLQAYLASSTVS